MNDSNLSHPTAKYINQLVNSQGFQFFVYIGSWAAYIWTFFYLFPITNSGGILGLSIIPISLGGWFWGMRAGLPLGILGIAGNTIMLSISRGHGLNNIDFSTFFDLGNFSVILISIVLTRYRSLSIQIQQGLKDRLVAERALWKSQQTLHVLMNSTDQTAMLIEPLDGKIITINQSGADRLGSPQQVLIGQSIYQYLPSELAQSRIEFVHKVVRTKRPQYFEDRRGDYFFRNAIHPVLNSEGEVENLAVFAEDITEQKHNQKLLEESIQEKEALLQELHHRVKNNLQIISSLGSLQAEGIKDQQLLDVFQIYQDRINSIALLHDMLYKSENLSAVNLEMYINDLIYHLKNSYGKNDPGNKIATVVNTNNINLNNEIIVPCGMIVTELVTNILKYAFPHDWNERNPEISICVDNLGDSKILLQIADNGVGFPKDFDIEKASTLGLRLVYILAAQLNGKVTIENKLGTTFNINFHQSTH